MEKNKMDDLIKVSGTLDERIKTHGPFNEYSYVAYEMRKIVNKNARTMSPIEAEGLNQIIGKIARIVTGDPSFKDHWHDIAGYAALVEKYDTK